MPLTQEQIKLLGLSDEEVKYIDTLLEMSYQRGEIAGYDKAKTIYSNIFTK